MRPGRPAGLPRLLAAAAPVPAVLVAVLLAGCASAPASAGQDLAGTPSPASAVATADPTSVALPEQRLDAGTVATGAPVTLTGEGPALVGFVRGDDVGVVARVDCTACTGTVTVRDAEQGTVWGTGTAPLSGTYLVDLHADDVTGRSVVLDVLGTWTIELSSWADLPVVTGPQQGTGAAVLRIGDEVSAVRLGYTPAGSGDELVGRAVPESDLASSDPPTVLSFGAESALQDVAVQLPLPGVVALSTAGSWSLVPVP